MAPAFVGLGFGLLWWLVGASAFGGEVRIGIAALGVALFGLGAWRIASGRTGRSGGGFDRRIYLAAVAVEIALIILAQARLKAMGRPDLLWPVVGITVGLHFIGLWRASGSRRFLHLTGALIAINAAALLLPLYNAGRTMLSGFGSATALLLSAAA